MRSSMLAPETPKPPKQPESGVLTLADLDPGLAGEVVGFRLAHEPLTQRLMQLGVLRGRRIDVVRRAPAGDPIEVRLAGSSLLLRRDEAARIEIRPCS